MKSLRLIALLLVPLACSSSTEPGSGPRLDFAAGAATYTDPPEVSGPPVVRPSRGRIEVEGVITAGDPCVQLRAESEREANRITVEVIARQQNVPCITIVAHFPYRVTLDGLEPGAYELAVVHAWESHDGTMYRSQPVVDRVVTVP